jgi:hypothetical protein
LDPDQSWPQIEDKVVSLTFHDWLEHPNSKLDCGDSDLGLGDRTFLIRRQHRQRMVVV